MPLKSNITSGWAGLMVLALGLTAPPLQADADLDVARQLNRAFVSVADKVSPSVVVIEVTQRLNRPNWHSEEDGTLDMIPPEMRRFFRNPTETPRETHGKGSGVIIREDGFILTNSHVVEDADKIKVQLKDGRSFDATVRGVDTQSDIAVIKIEATGLPAARLGDSDKTRVGEFAIAIGAPFELDYSVTFGHVSAKGRRVFSDFVMMDQDFIQTDASINPGNSGGPLVNIDGEVIGVNTLIRGMNTGIGFAVPVNLAREVADQLIESGKFARGWLGIGIATLAEDNEFRSLISGIKEGVVVRSIVPGGPAADSDLKPTDIITEVDGKKIATAQDLKREIRVKPAGKSVDLKVFRDGRTVALKVVPGELPSNAMEAMFRRPATAETGSTSLGLRVEPVTPDLARQLGLDTRKGVVVTEVEADSPAAAKGIQPGDVITKVDKDRVGNPREFEKALADADLEKGVIVNLVNESGQRFEVLKSGGD